MCSQYLLIIVNHIEALRGSHFCSITFINNLSPQFHVQSVSRVQPVMSCMYNVSHFLLISDRSCSCTDARVLLFSAAAAIASVQQSDGGHAGDQDHCVQVSPEALGGQGESSVMRGKDFTFCYRPGQGDSLPVSARVSIRGQNC